MPRHFETLTHIREILQSYSKVKERKKRKKRKKHFDKGNKCEKMYSKIYKKKIFLKKTRYFKKSV